MVEVGRGRIVFSGRDKKCKLKGHPDGAICCRGPGTELPVTLLRVHSKVDMFFTESEFIRGKRKNPPLSGDLARGGSGETHTTKHH